MLDRFFGEEGCFGGGGWWCGGQQNYPTLLKECKH